MFSYTQRVMVTHRGPVIPCQRHMFRSSQVIFLFFSFQLHTARGFLSLLCHATRTTSSNPSSSTILIGLQLFAIHLANCASQLVTGRLNEGPTLFSEGGLAHSTLTPLADQRMHRVEVVLIATVKR